MAGKSVSFFKVFQKRSLIFAIQIFPKERKKGAERRLVNEVPVFPNIGKRFFLRVPKNVCEGVRQLVALFGERFDRGFGVVVFFAEAQKGFDFSEEHDGKFRRRFVALEAFGNKNFLLALPCGDSVAMRIETA